VIALGTIHMVTNAYGTVFKAFYQPNYRYNAQRIASDRLDLGHDWPTESDAIAALEAKARNHGLRIGIQAGSYPRGTRRCGDSIATA
jgi:hypothetical protein